MVDAGVPSGISSSLAYRLSARWRLHAGLSHNLVGLGVRGGVRLRATTARVSPTLSLEAGRFARADAGWLAGAVGAETDTASLQSMGYAYGGGHAGVEISGDNATFFVELGAASIGGTLYFEDVTEQSGVQREVRTATDVDFWTLSGRAGVMVWF